MSLVPYFMWQRATRNNSSRRENTGPGCLIFVVIASIGLLITVLIGCGGPPSYTVKYTVIAKYWEKDTDTLSGTIVTQTFNPERINFTISSRLRKEPCLILLGDTDDLGQISNIACGVKSFNVKELTVTKVKKQ